jgi:hypothetical protein
MIDADLCADLERSFAAALDTDEVALARARLLDAGWLDALGAEEAVATALVFRAQGRLASDAAALDDVLARHLVGGLDLEPGAVAVAHPVARGGPVEGRPSHVVLPANADATHVLWLGDLAGGRCLIELAGPLGASPVGGLDPQAGLLGLVAPPTGRVVDDGTGTGDWEAAMAAGRVAVAHQLVAAAHATLRLAAEYATARRQFDQPIASFQAVKHRLAETLVAISAADAAAVAAASSADPLAAATAKVLAGRASATTSRNCLQVFGGIGFTTEHDFPARLRQGLLLDRMLGDHAALERELGGRVRRRELVGHRFVELDDAPVVSLLGGLTA